MNHLGCDGSMKVVFDAGDAKLDCDEEDEDEDEEAVRAKQAQDETLQVDLSRLRGEPASPACGDAASCALD